ncbi:MAG TPA: PEGA domain-containing protein [Candidatus Binataceae bacterium]|nr:PEGA domain-containing protein [Candidatus Binataceae bacterium]
MNKLIALGCLGLLLCSSCATLFQGTKEEVMVNSDPSGANVTVNDGRSGVTPYSFRTSRDEDLQIHVSKPGYQPTDISDNSKFEWGYGISDIFFTGLIGLGIDAMDGASFYHEQTMVAAHLDPVTPAAPVAQAAQMSSLAANGKADSTVAGAASPTASQQAPNSAAQDANKNF